MALNVTESHALATLLRALGVGIHGRLDPTPLREGQLLVALGVLTASAGKTLRLGWDPDDLRALDTRLSAPPVPAAPDWLLATIDLLGAVRDHEVYSDHQSGITWRTVSSEGRIEVTAAIEAFATRGLVDLTPAGHPLTMWQLTVLGRSHLSLLDPSRCHYINLSGRHCRRSGPHEDWCCDFDTPGSPGGQMPAEQERIGTGSQAAAGQTLT